VALKLVSREPLVIDKTILLSLYVLDGAQQLEQSVASTVGPLHWVSGIVPDGSSGMIP